VVSQHSGRGELRSTGTVLMEDEVVPARADSRERAEIHCGEAAVSSATGRREPERTFARIAGASGDPPSRSEG